MNIGIIGEGAIGRFVRDRILAAGDVVRAVVVPPRSVHTHPAENQKTVRVASIADLPEDIDHMIDCAGHSGLSEHGPAILERGIDLTTVSIGALADPDLYRTLEQAANKGRSRLRLASGAIGALDCLRAARVGELRRVTYIGRKPPLGWKGSPAERTLQLEALGATPKVHFEGNARQAATSYPKNANVAAAVALAGIGFDDTHVQLIADPTISENVHEIEACGDFGSFSFQVRGHSLPDNPRSSALAAMSVVSSLRDEKHSIRF